SGDAARSDPRDRRGRRPGHRGGGSGHRRGARRTLARQRAAPYGRADRTPRREEGETMSTKDVAQRFTDSVHKMIVGQDETIRLAFMALALRGHVLLEGAPVTAKTLLARTAARLIGGSFKRIQFTPDLMPSDIVGTSIFEIATSSFRIRLGPVFANVVLADEVNRAPAKLRPRFSKRWRSDRSRWR